VNWWDSFPGHAKGNGRPQMLRPSSQNQTWDQILQCGVCYGECNARIRAAGLFGDKGGPKPSVWIKPTVTAPRAISLIPPSLQTTANQPWTRFPAQLVARKHWRSNCGPNAHLSGLHPFIAPTGILIGSVIGSVNQYVSRSRDRARENFWRWSNQSRSLAGGGYSLNASS